VAKGEQRKRQRDGQGSCGAVRTAACPRLSRPHGSPAARLPDLLCSPPPCTCTCPALT
jgi:hypothetical protein